MRKLLRNLFRIFNDLRFALFLLFFIAFVSSLGSFIEQDQPTSFYKSFYSFEKPVYGFITYQFLFFFGLDHIYKTFWFFSLLFFLGLSLISCTFTRQFPLFQTSKEYFFKKKANSFIILPFFTRVQPFPFLKEYIISRLEETNFYIYQKENFIYAYRGLIGRVSPILVHISLLFILGGSIFGALENFQAQEFLPKGELFQIQNPISTGFFTTFPKFGIRVNDFWVEYEKEKIHQFYSDLSIINSEGNEQNHYTISVNNPFRYKGVDIYQSDWNLLGIRGLKIDKKEIFQDFSSQVNPLQFSSYEFPLFPVQGATKYWITWIPDTLNLNEISSAQNLSKLNDSQNGCYLLFDQLQEVFLKYDKNGKFLEILTIGENSLANLKINEIISATGLLIKSDPSIPIIYFGFGLLMITTFLSLLPYNQIWIFSQSLSLNSLAEKDKITDFSSSKKINNLIRGNYWIGGSSNRGKIQFEIEFRNLMNQLYNYIKEKKFNLEKPLI